MNNPFGNGGGDPKDEELLSEGDPEREHEHALMNSQLEISPLVPFVPPMPGESTGSEHRGATATVTAATKKRPFAGPPLGSSSSSSAKSQPLLLKKRKLNDHVTAQDFRDIGSPTQPPAPSISHGQAKAPIPASAQLDVNAPVTAAAKQPPSASLSARPTTATATANNARPPAAGPVPAASGQQKPIVISAYTSIKPKSTLAPLAPRPPPGAVAAATTTTTNPMIAGPAQLHPCGMAGATHSGTVPQVAPAASPMFSGGRVGGAPARSAGPVVISAYTKPAGLTALAPRPNPAAATAAPAVPNTLLQAANQFLAAAQPASATNVQAASQAGADLRTPSTLASPPAPGQGGQAVLAAAPQFSASPHTMSKPTAPSPGASSAAAEESTEPETGDNVPLKIPKDIARMYHRKRRPESTDDDVATDEQERLKSPPRPSENAAAKKRADILAIVTGTKSPRKVEASQDAPAAAPVAATATAPTPTPNTITTTSAAPSPPTGPSPRTAPPVASTEKKRPTADANASGAKPKKKGGRKKTPNPTRRVLLARKEREAAGALLKDKIDLLHCLPKEDCQFLAKKFWIFTAQQLLVVLDGPSNAEVDSDETMKLLQNTKEIREALVTGIAVYAREEASKPKQDPAAGDGGTVNPEKESPAKTDAAGEIPGEERVDNLDVTADPGKESSDVKASPETDVKAKERVVKVEEVSTEPTKETSVPQTSSTAADPAKESVTEANGTAVRPTKESVTSASSAAAKRPGKDPVASTSDVATKSGQSTDDSVRNVFMQPPAPSPPKKVEVRPPKPPPLDPMPEKSITALFESYAPSGSVDVPTLKPPSITALLDAYASPTQPPPPPKTITVKTSIKETSKNPFNVPVPIMPKPPKERKVDSKVDSKVDLKVDSKVDVYQEEVPETTPPVELGEDERLKAESKLARWRNAVKIRMDDSEGLSMEKSFPIEGPMAFLIPTSTRRFLVSAKIATLYQFLCLKKTETGAICDMMRLWRQESALAPLPPLALAKHLLGVSYRLEVAFGSVPVDAKTQLWLNDAIVIMTGAAREFLVDHLGICSAQKFLDYKTKDLSELLADWRKAKGLPLLKGSGKVAMVSGWKAICREEVSIQSFPGKVLTDVDLEGMSARAIPIIKDESTPDPDNLAKPKAKPKSKPKTKSKAKPKASAEKPKPPPSNPKVEYALHSPLFVEHALGKSVAAFLSSAGITTASGLEKAKVDTGSVLYKKMLETQRADDIAGCQKQIEGWSSTLQQQLKDFTKEEEPIEKKPSILKVSTGTTSKTSKYKDPYEALTTSSKQFLGTMGITTGEQFLSTRTTDIAAEFIKWRVKEGKPELKGLGAIASVSGWKAQCRKAATDMGLDHIAAIDPNNMKRSGPSAKKKKPASAGTAKRSSPSASPVPSLAATVTPTVGRSSNPLTEESSVVFAVQKLQQSNRKFFFQVSLRRVNDSQPLQTFLTYRGASPAGTTSPKTGETTIRLESAARSSASVAVPLLASVPGTKRDTYSHFDERGPFTPTARDHGLIELAAFGVEPVVELELGPLKTVIRNFILGRVDVPLSAESLSHEYVTNVLIHRQAATGQRQGPSGLRYFLHLTSALEKGQTCPLRFPSLPSLLRPERYDKSAYRTRLMIEDALAVLAQGDLGRVLGWLRQDGELQKIKTVDKPDGLPSEEICKGCRRMHWVSRRILALLRKMSDDSRDIQKALKFGPRWEGKGGLSEAQSLELTNILGSQLKEELLSSVENDAVCGAHMRPNWCKTAQDMFHVCIDQLVACYALPTEGCAQVFVDKMKSALSPFFKVEDEQKQESLQNGEALVAGEDEGWDPMATDASPLGTIACYDETKAGEIVFKSLTDVKDGKAKVAFVWYKEQLWGIASRLLLLFDQLLDDGERIQFDVPKALKSLRPELQIEEPSRNFTTSPHLSQERIALPWGYDPNQETQSRIPGSYQFFLGIVWPELREQGWRLEAGDAATEVAFFPPKTTQKKRSALLKQERNRKRARLSREIDKLGWGSVKKLTKRIVGAISPGLDVEDGQLELPPDSKSVTVEEATNFLVKWVQKDLPENDDDASSTERVEAIAAATRECFNQIAPYMSDGAGWPLNPDDGGAAPSSSQRAETMLQLLLVLPTILRQSSLPLQEISDSLQIIQEMTLMFTAEHKDLLDKRFHPPVEKYAEEEAPSKSNLAVRLKLLKPVADVPDGDTEMADTNELTEAILEEDKKGLTDFVVSVMEQFIPCRATERDAEKKYRRIHVGYPGLTCRHCTGNMGEGRYFFSTIESLTTASTVLEKHVYKCTRTPPEVRARVVNARTHHAAQRKTLENGSQQGYFNRLWDRLRSANIGGTNNVPAFGEYQGYGGGGGDAAGRHSTGGTTNDGVSDFDGSEFRDHLQILDFVRTTTPWKHNKSIQGALNKYYSCLDYGGRIYQTPSMPKHFSAEWLLAKVVPHRYEYAKTKNLPG